MPTTEGGAQFHCGKQSSESRFGTANRARYGKHHPSRTLTGTRKQNDFQPAMQVRPTHQAQIEVQNASLDKHAKEDTIKYRSTMTSKHENDLPGKTSRKDHPGTEKVCGDFVIRTTAENEGTKGSDGNNKGRKHVESALQGAIKKSLKEYELPNSKFVGDDPCHNHDKENIYSFKDEVDGLSRHVGASNLGNDAV